MDIVGEELYVYTDGGARGNPGPAAIGVVLGGKKYGSQIGYATNNEAEYQAVLFALHKAKQIIGKKASRETALEIYMDSELVYKQLNGRYKVSEPKLQKFFIDVWNLKQDFKAVSFSNVPREQNKEADKLANEALDEK